VPFSWVANFLGEKITHLGESFSNAKQPIHSPHPHHSFLELSHFRLHSTLLSQSLRPGINTGSCPQLPSLPHTHPVTLILSCVAPCGVVGLLSGTVSKKLSFLSSDLLTLLYLKISTNELTLNQEHNPWNFSISQFQESMWI
jgi:hypothetical protein